ncbi:MAG TPA: Fis family transcriptional regulator [Thiothrix sp.]|nr:Fis family transcriptional regulator [Thiothrix sp.]
MKTTTPQAQSLQASLAQTVERVMNDYLEAIGDQEPTNVYRLVIDEVERPMLEVLMSHTNNNQSKAAKYLGINRATLRTKLKRYDLL